MTKAQFLHRPTPSPQQWPDALERILAMFAEAASPDEPAELSISNAVNTPFDQLDEAQLLICIELLTTINEDLGGVLQEPPTISDIIEEVDEQ